VAHKDSKWEKGMTPAQKEKFEKKDAKNDKALAKEIKKSVKPKKSKKSK
jgi:hypothetical protein